MKNKIVIMIVFSILILNCFSFISLSTNNLNLNNTDIKFSDSIVFDGLNILNRQTDFFVNISLENCGETGEIGSPLLPFISLKYLIPYENKIKDIKITTSNPDVIELSKQVYPVQEELDENEKVFSLNENVYCSDNFVFNKKYSQDIQVSYMRGYPIFYLNLYPVDYKPLSNTLYFYKSYDIEIEFEFDNNYQNNMFLRDKQNDVTLISSFVRNPIFLNSYSDLFNNDLNQPLMSGNYPGGLCDPSDNFDYIIITDQSFKDSWQPLLYHRLQHDGLTGIAVSWQEIDAESDYHSSNPIFDDIPAHMHEFCKDAYIDWGAEYLLLGGTWSPNFKTCPYKLMYYSTGTDDDRFPCDLYFSNLDDDWYVSYEDGLNSGYEEYFGLNALNCKDVIDYGRELFCGRLPVHNANDVSNIVSKIIWYDNYENNDNWLSKTAWVGGYLGFTHESNEYLDLIRIDHTKAWNPCPPSDGLIYNNNHQDAQIDLYNHVYYYADLGGSFQDEFNDAFSNGEVSLVLHKAHGSYTSVFGTRIYNSPDKPVAGLTSACNTMNLEHDNCEGEKLLNAEGGLYMLVAGTRTVFGGYAATSFHWFMDYFFRPHSNPNNGKAMQWSEQNIDLGISSAKHGNWMYLHLFGDPAQTLRFSNEDSGDNYDPNNPSIPSGPSSGDIGETLTFSTSTNDPDGDKVCYGWDWDGNGIIDEWSGLINSGSTETRTHSWSIANNYNVKVIAKDEHDAMSGFSPVKTVYIGIENNPPYKPSNPHPEDNSIDQGLNIQLSWTGGDPDTDDIVTYDIYFGEDSDPPLVKSGHTSTEYDPGVLEPNTQYFWKIVSKDNFLAQNSSDLWSFKTVRTSTSISKNFFMYTFMRLLFMLKTQFMSHLLKYNIISP